jgi:hypothetical protein
MSIIIILFIALIKTQYKNSYTINGNGGLIQVTEFLKIKKIIRIISDKRRAPASHGCNSDAKVFLNYIMHINLPHESLYLLKNRIEIR